MNYTLIIRNNLTKKVNVINSFSQNDGIFLKFEDLDFSDYDDGEYTLYVIQNEEELPIVIYQNNVPKTQITSTKYILVNGDSIFTDNGAIIYIDGDAYQMPIQIVATELMRIGNYQPNNKQYNKERTFKQYGSK